jgi:tight adherence protein C
LREANQSLWLLRKSIARKKGEEASTKALLPMLLIFSVMLMIIGSPAFLMMQK